jgi:hypothetical protein
MDSRLASVGDRSEQSEDAMIAHMWPDQKQPVTAAPRATVNASGAGKVAVTLASETTGASIGYRRPGRADQGWQIYTVPVVVESGEALEAKAVRYGYAESPVTQVATGKR